MRGDGDQVGIGQVELAGSLCAIGEQQPARAVHRLGDPIERLDHPGLVVDLLHRDQPRQRRVRGIDASGGIDRQPRRLAGPAQHRLVLDRRHRGERKPAAVRDRDCNRLGRAEVNTTSPSQRSARRIRSRASSSAARTARPAACGLEGLAHIA